MKIPNIEIPDEYAFILTKHYLADMVVNTNKMIENLESYGELQDWQAKDLEETRFYFTCLSNTLKYLCVDGDFETIITMASIRIESEEQDQEDYE